MHDARRALLAAVIVFGSLQAAQAGQIKFETEVPKAPKELPVLKLTPSEAPLELVGRLVSEAGGRGQLQPLSETPLLRENQVKVPEEFIGVVEGEHVRAWVNRRTGDASIYPSLPSLEPMPANTRDASAKAREIFASPQFIPHDDTRFKVDSQGTLYGATLERDAAGKVAMTKPKSPYLTYLAAHRLVEGLPVDGPGSRALLEVDGRGVVQGLTRSWKAAKTSGTVKPAFSDVQVKAAIARQFQATLKNADVVVDRIELAYFDDNRETIRPAYRFTARIAHAAARDKAATSDDFVVGYVPFAPGLEALPSLEARSGPQPSVAEQAPRQPAVAKVAAAGIDPVVGRYVVRQDDAGWVNDANAFWSSLSSSGTGSLYTNAQYYWAEPRLFTTQKDSFINAMNLALIEVHGDWWLFSTLKNCCDLVNINGDVPSPGYGPAANGHLADWVIHSCEVVPSPEDTAQWPAPWWNVFGGVRNVVGYRTIMYINDGAGGPYGTSLGNLAPVVSSWLSDVISLNAYAGHPAMAAHGGVVRPMGRPATVSMCGHDNDSVLSTSSLSRANCLTAWWFPD
jgi:hypothetical protein